MKNYLLLFALSIITISLNAQTEISDENISDKLIQQNDKVIVMDFYATWCGPCVKMEPIMKRLENQYAGSVEFYKMDVDKNKADDQLEVTSIPTYYIIKNGKTLEKFEGARSEADMKKIIDKHLGKSNDLVNKTHYHRNDEFTDAYLAKYENNSTQLNNIAWHAYLDHNEVDILLKALEVAEKSVEMEKTSYNLDTHAALLYKLGRYDFALKQAKLSIDYAKSEGKDHSATTELMYKIIDKL